MFTKRSPRLRPSPWDALIVLLVVFAAVACGGFIWTQGAHQSGSLQAVISVDGVTTDTIPLTKATSAEQTISHNGYTLHVHLTPEGVWVDSSDCPTQDCVRTGTITRSGQSIVCLPARVIIQLEGSIEDHADSPDIVIG